MTKKIIFTPMTEMAKHFSIKPIPASKTLPDWYKDAHTFLNGADEYRLDNKGASNTTFKACTPFLDAMMSGYSVVLASDLFVFNENGKLNIRWRTTNDVVEGHVYEITAGIPRMHNENKEIIKWIFDWHIKTPNGYSCFYTHPHNRPELPFRTFSGVVDTDMYPDSVHFPFQLMEFKNDFFILKGTPICQIFPFKRENWISEERDVIPYMKEKAIYEILSKVKRSYKNQFWQRKSYK